MTAVARRAVGWLAVLAVAATGLGLFAPTSASGSCAGPQLEVTSATLRATPTSEAAPPAVVAVGGALTVRGQFFANGCNDTQGYGGGPGCQGPVEQETVTPMRGVQLVLTQNDRTWVLGTADGDAPGGMLWRTRLPAEVVPGPATLTAATATLGLLVVAV